LAPITTVLPDMAAEIPKAAPRPASVGFSSGCLATADALVAFLTAAPACSHRGVFTLARWWHRKKGPEADV
jgi:hypothetical protein